MLKVQSINLKKEDLEDYFINLVTKADEGDEHSMRLLLAEYSVGFNSLERMGTISAETIEYLKSRIGKPYSTHFYISLLTLGLGVKRDVKEAKRLTKKYQDRCGELTYELATFYLKKKPERAKALLRKAATFPGSPSINAPHLLGILYKEDDPERSMTYLRKALELGNIRACDTIGQRLHSEATEGEEVDKKKMRKALAYYRKGIEMGDHHASFTLGVTYMHAEGVKEDLEKAKKYLKISSELGNSQAIVNLATIFKDEGDISEAKRYLKRALELEDPCAYLNLGYLYRDEGRKKKCIKAYLGGAKFNNEFGMRCKFELGKMGIPPDLDPSLVSQALKEIAVLRETFGHFGAFDLD